MLSACGLRAQRARRLFVATLSLVFAVRWQLGRCGGVHEIPAGTLYRPASKGPGSAGPLRGRKRDVWEGGHRVPGIISWPAMVDGQYQSHCHAVQARPRLDPSWAVAVFNPSACTERLH